MGEREERSECVERSMDVLLLLDLKTLSGCLLTEISAGGRISFRHFCILKKNDLSIHYSEKLLFDII